MNASPEKNLDLTVEIPDEDFPDKTSRKASAVDVPRPKDIDLSDGTDQDDKPIDNPSG